MIHFELIILGVNKDSLFQISACEYPLVPASFVEKTILSLFSHWIVLEPLLKIIWPQVYKFTSRLLLYPLLYIPTYPHAVPFILIAVAFW